LKFQIFDIWAYGRILNILLLVHNKLTTHKLFKSLKSMLMD
jgi:hypothetical protein